MSMPTYNDRINESNWDEINALTDGQKIQACLNSGILTDNDVQDGLFTTTDLTDWLYDYGYSAETILQL